MSTSDEDGERRVESGAPERTDGGAAQWTGLLAGKTAVVTGGASGIGREIAIQFARHGADTVLADVRRTPRGGGTPTDEVIERETDAEATYVECDVAAPDEVAAVIETAAADGLDVLVNNAAVARLDDYDADREIVDRFFDVNVKGCLYAARTAAAEMDTGCILNVSSVEALAGTGPRPVYGATRGALRQLTFALADRLGPEIRVNSILPGLIDTELVREDVPILGDDEALAALEAATPLSRYGDPREIADPAVFLASDLASFVTGAELVADGGLTYTQ
ncbi:SDR family NAD(P)-dependent oxidoreductase [Halobaculum sp. MBLA0147]|uniref:SDR family NAD(P)-dependent oxidoreductase n=1 Tax=Halobaculum sp. MBLA0147 TaxID=3079934 RepID=UPI003525386E